MSASSILGLAGNYFFGPIGGFIGSTLGNLLGPKPDDIENFGPRLSDRKIQVASYGQARPIVYGTMQLAGTIIEPKNFELDETVSVTKESGGKGGGGPSTTNTTYSYSATFATLLCEGPIVGIRKIWLDSVLVYDFSASTTAEAIIASNMAANGIRIYTGSETQMPDSILESLNGSGNTPAYRGSAYLVFDNLQLEKYGNRLPNVRCEVVGSGSTSIAWKLAEHTDHPTPYTSGSITSYDNGVYRVWDGVENSGDVHLIDPNGVYLGSEPVSAKEIRVISQDNFPSDKISGALDRMLEVGTLGTGIGSSFVYVSNVISYPSPAGTFKIEAYYPDDTFGDFIERDITPDLPQDRYVIGVAVSADHERMIVIMGDDIGTPASSAHLVGIWFMYDKNINKIDSGICDFSGKPASVATFGFGGTAQQGFTAGMLESNYTTLWTAYSAGNKDVDYWEIDSSGIFSYTYGETFSLSNLDNGDKMTVYADNGVFAVAGQYDIGTTDGYFSLFSRESLYTSTGATLSDIVDDIEDRAGVTSANRDNASLSDTVDGYMISRLTTARRSIEPLQTAFFFDAIETDYKLKSISRGGTSVATIPITDMGAIEYGSNPIFPLEKTRQQEVELPKEIVAKYISPMRGYEVGTQRSQRIETLSREKKQIDIPIAMTDTKAKQVAEVLHYNAWTERNLFSFSLMPKYGYLDPSDVIDITDGSTTYTIRIVSMDLSIGGVIQCQGVADRSAVYSSTSIGADNDADGVTVTQIGPTKSIYGNWPMFTNGFNNEAIYIASAGLLSGWKGGINYRSLDNGANYGQVSIAATGSTIGFTTDILADGDFSTFDYLSSVNVNLQSGTLSSATQEAVLNGANPIMIGSELIQFMTATLESNGTYTLSKLLRGRKGTEWAMASHAIGENAVFIDETVLRPTAVLNIERKYKAVSIGNFLADTYPENVTYTGINLKPLSPVNLIGVRDASGNLTANFTRRSRFEASPLWSPQVGEDSESYEIDILNAGSVVRTISVAAETASYTSAQQTADFGSNQSSVDMKIYQLSGTIGRGYDLAGTI